MKQQVLAVDGLVADATRDRLKLARLASMAARRRAGRSGPSAEVSHVESTRAARAAEDASGIDSSRGQPTRAEPSPYDSMRTGATSAWSVPAQAEAVTPLPPACVPSAIRGRTSKKGHGGGRLARIGLAVATSLALAGVVVAFGPGELRDGIGFLAKLPRSAPATGTNDTAIADLLGGDRSGPDRRPPTALAALAPEPAPSAPSPVPPRSAGAPEAPPLEAPRVDSAPETQSEATSNPLVATVSSGSAASATALPPGTPPAAGARVGAPPGASPSLPAQSPGRAHPDLDDMNFRFSVKPLDAR
jgi:hypothetical protein